MDNSALYKLGYGLYILTAKDGDKDNGCIVNSVMQATSSPTIQILTTLNKQNFTHDMILKTKEFNISVLTEQTPFKVFQHFGFQSGKDINKFQKNDAVIRGENGIYYIPKYSNSYISAKVNSCIDLGSHTLFISEVTAAKTLSTNETLTYAYYQSNIKQKPQVEKKGWVCKICGYVHESEELPNDFICPICKHGASDFEKLS